MPPKRHSSLPKPYGRQAEGKTIKSLSLDAELVAWSEQKAQADGRSLSAWLNSLLRTTKDSQRPTSSKSGAKGKTRPKAKGKK